MSLKIGGSKSRSSSRSKSESSPYFRNTGYSSFDPKTRVFSLDPSIRAAEDTANQRYASVYGDFGNASDRFLNQSSGLRSRLLGNEGGYLKAVLDPIRERFSALRGQTQQDLGLRRLSGSTFANDSLRDIDTQASREEANASSLAKQELIRMESALNESELSALNQAAAQRAAVTGESLDVAKLRAARELEIFKIGQNAKSKGSQKESGISGSASGNLITGGSA